jgi:signal transduction histidine kinase
LVHGGTKHYSTIGGDLSPHGEWRFWGRTFGFRRETGKVRNRRAVTTWSDITTLKQREAELADLVQRLEIARDEAMEASRTKSSFLANMSHELRTPLNAIIGLTELLCDNAARFGTEKALEPLRRVLRAGRHLLNLINDILDLSKIEAGKMDLTLESVAIGPVVEEVLGTARPLAEQNQQRTRARLSRADRLGSCRQHAAAPDPAEPVEQRLQVHQERHRSDCASRCSAGTRSSAPGMAPLGSRWRPASDLI